MPWLKNSKFLVVVLGLFLLLAGFRISFPDLDHGDEFSDSNVLNAGENFVRFGFIKTRFLPMFEPSPEEPTDLYTHYPPLPDIINGILRMAFKTDSLVFFRFVSLLFSCLGLVFWCLLIMRLTKSKLLGLLSGLFLLANPLFIFSMDSLHQLSYGECLRFLIIFVTILLVSSPGKMKAILLWILFMVESWVSFEYVFYLVLFFLLFNIFYKGEKGRLTKKTFFLLMLAPVCGFLLHLLQNIWYLGSLSLAYQDLKSIAVARIANSRDAGGVTLSLSNWVKDVFLRNISLVFIFNYFTLLLAAFFSLVLYPFLSGEVRKNIRILLRLAILLFVCGMTWYIVFPSHSLSHTYLYFLARHLMPAAVLTFTVFAYLIISFIRERLNSKRIYAVFSVIILLAILITGITQSQLPVTPEKVKISREFVKFKQSLLYLRQISQSGDEVGVNYFRYPFIRYYAHRRCRSVFDKSSLERLEQLPKYFIFIPYNSQASQELLDFLNLRYLPIFRCDSQRFPSIFFELKQ